MNSSKVPFDKFSEEQKAQFVRGYVRLVLISLKDYWINRTVIVIFGLTLIYCNRFYIIKILIILIALVYKFCV